MTNYLTSTVSSLLNTILPYQGSPDTNPVLLGVLADALEDADCQEHEAIRLLRASNLSWSSRIDGIYSMVREVREIAAAKTKAEVAAAHLVATGDAVAAMLAESKAAYSRREVGHGYQLRERAQLIQSRVGYVDAVTHDLRGTPPAGVIWIRWSKGGKFSSSRKMKFGRPLTVSELMKRAK